MPENVNDTNKSNFLMTLQGEGSVFVTPDIGIIQLGVETTGQDLSEIQQMNAQLSRQVLTAITQTGVNPRDIQTVDYQIQKLYDFEDGKRIDRGFQVINVFKVTVRNLELIGSIIDTAVENGANLVTNIQFQVENTSPHYQQALDLALVNAIDKAEAIGRQLNVPVLLIPTRITEVSSNVIPVSSRMYSISETPIQPGQNEIVARIEADFAYRPV